MDFDRDAAKKAGYSDEEIDIFLSQSSTSPRNRSNFNVNAALQAGYSQEEIEEFLSQSSPKQGGIRGELERKVAAPVTEFATKFATAIPELSRGVSNLTAQGMNKLSKLFGGKELSQEQISDIVSSVGGMSTLGQIPEASSIKEFIKEKTGGRLEPTTPTERVLTGGAGILGEIAGLGPEAVFGTPAKLAGSLALAGTTEALQEEGVNPWLALGGGIFADILTRSGINVGKKIASTLKKGIPAAAGELTAESIKLSPKDIRQGVVEAGERLGITQGEIPLSAQIESPAITSIETKLRESSLAGKSLENQLANVEGKVRGSFFEIADELSLRKDLLPGAVSEEAISQLSNIERNAQEAYSSLYRQAEKKLPSFAVTEAKEGKNILTHLEKQIEQLSKGAGTPAKDALRSRLSRLYTDWSGRFSDGGIPINELIELKKDLNQIIKYEVKGGVDKALLPLQNMTKNAIQKYGIDNREFLNRFNEAERRFSQAAKDFRKSDVISSLLSTQNPQQIINRMKNVKNYRELKNLMGKTLEGKQAFQDLSRYLLEDIIGSKLLNKNGTISWGNASGVLKNPKNREIVREILGPSNYAKLKDIVKISSGIEQGLRKFANTSATATKGFDIALLLGTVGKGIGQIFAGNVIKGGKSMALVLAPSTMAKLISNPEFIDAMIEVSKAGRGNSSRVFFDAAERAARFIVPAITESYTDASENI